VLYEDILWIWIALLIYGFAPTYKIGLSFSNILGLLFIKEFFFLVSLFYLRKRLHHNFFLVLIYLFFFIDLSLLGLGRISEHIPLGDLLIVAWFLHYYFLYKKAFFHLGKDYLKLLIGIILPFIILVLIENFFDFFHLSFKGEMLFFLIAILVVAPFFIKKIWPLKPLTDPFYRNFISSFFASQKIKIKELYLLLNSGKTLYTAGILGIFSPFRYFFISPDLLNMLTEEELLGVLAHEAGHVKKRHMLWLSLIFFNFPLFLGIILILILKVFKLSELWTSFFLIIISFLYFRLVFAYFLRSFEREADYYSYKVLGSAIPLSSALLKIGDVSGQLYKKNWHHYGIIERISFLASIKGKEKALEGFFRRLRAFVLLWFIGDVFLMWFLML